MLRALLGRCRPDPKTCCSCEDELLTAAWRESLEQASAVPEEYADCSTPNSVVAYRAGGTSNSYHETLSTGSSPGSGIGGVSLSLDRVGGEPPAHGGPPLLEVPPEFGHLQLDKVWDAPGGAGGFGGGLAESWHDEEEQRGFLRTSLRAFVRSMLQGVCIHVLHGDGQTVIAEAWLNSELTHLVLHTPKVQRPVALRFIKGICSAEETMYSGQSQTRFLDSRCTNFILQDGQVLTFVFSNKDTRDYFEVCMKVVLLAKAPGGPTAHEGSASQLPDTLA